MTSTAITPTHVAYDACPTGYTVRVLSANATLAEYSTGNSRQGATIVLPPEDVDAIPERILLDLAKQTAKVMAAEYGSLPIERNKNLLAEERGE